MNRYRRSGSSCRKTEGRLRAEPQTLNRNRFRSGKPGQSHLKATPRLNGAYLRFSKSTGFSTVAEDRCEGALLAFQPLSRYAPIPEPEPNSLPTASRPPSSPLQAYYWPTSSQLVGNHSDVDRIHIGVVA